jgi:two-component system cell cycle response regulator CpdR
MEKQLKQRKIEAVEPNILRGKRILVADDEQAVREAISMLLSVDDHTVTEAENGAEAFAIFTQGKFDLVITDFAMPVMKGNELAVKIKNLAPNQPVVMLTAYAEQRNAENPVDLVINKPFHLHELREAIAEVCS